MVSEEIIIERDRIECIVQNLIDMLRVESHYQFKLRFSQDKSGGRTLSITPHAQSVDITLIR